MKIIIIGSSTGGPYILEEILSHFPSLPCAIILVQHLPPTFTNTFKTHIATLTRMNVTIAGEDQKIAEGTLFIAPAGQHLLLRNNRSFIFDDGDKIHGVRPAVDRTLLTIQKRSEDKILPGA